jgi:hypothetical protein
MIPRSPFNFSRVLGSGNKETHEGGRSRGAGKPASLLRPKVNEFVVRHNHNKLGKRKVANVSGHKSSELTKIILAGDYGTSGIISREYIYVDRTFPACLRLEDRELRVRLKHKIFFSYLGTQEPAQ